MINLEDKFFKIFGTNVEYFYKTPGRINLIGEHIDYNGGVVLPCAISRYIYLYVSIRSDNIIKFASTKYDTIFERNLNNLDYNKDDDWAIHGFGVIKVLQNHGYVVPKGLNIFIDSTIPVASGLSSSAGFLVAMLFMLNDLFHFKIGKLDLIKYAQLVENEYLGLKSGVMDQASIVLGDKNKAILLDCKNLDYELVDVNLNDYSLVVLQTNKERKLKESCYNERVDECNEALSIIKKAYPDISYLTDLKISNLPNIEKMLDNKLFRRVKHIVTEQQRVYDFYNALKDNNLVNAGLILNDSHESLRTDYEVTGLHLDTICELARINHALGARMTGAGMGGCAIALVKKDEFALFKENVINGYKEKIGFAPDVYTVDITRGPKKMQL